MNMLIFPGFAISSTTNLYVLIKTTGISKLKVLFNNFYLIKNGDFFLNLII